MSETLTRNATRMAESFGKALAERPDAPDAPLFEATQILLRDLCAALTRAEWRADRLQKDVNEAATIMAGLMKEHEREHAIAERAEQRAYHAEQKLAAFTVEPLCALRDYKAQRDRADAAEDELRAVRARE